MKYNKKNLSYLLTQSDDLQKEVINYVLDKWEEYDKKEDIVLEVLEHGCKSGIVGNLIYYSDTTKFYDKYKELINELVYELIDETCEKIDVLFKDFDVKDPLILNSWNKNLFAWYGFEETMYRLAMLFDIV